MPQAPQQALQPAESPSIPLSSLHLTGSLPQVPHMLPYVRVPSAECPTLLCQITCPSTLGHFMDKH